jgi:hypothetical protein
LAVAVVLAVALPLAWSINRSAHRTPKTDTLVPPPPATAVLERAIPKPTNDFYRARPKVTFVDAQHGWAAFANCDAYKQTGCKIGLMSTSDSGLTWRNVNLPATDADELELYPVDADHFTVFAKPLGVLWVTRDGGAHFANYAADRPPVEAQLARGGPFQALCPGDGGFQALECPIKRVVRIGSGPQPVMPSWAGDPETFVKVVNGGDGSVWYVKYTTSTAARVAVSKDEGRIWTEMDRLPAGDFSLSPDGTEAWAIGPQAIWELTPGGWHYTSRPFPHQGAGSFGAPIGWHRLLLNTDRGMAFIWADGKISFIPGIAEGQVTARTDGSVLIDIWEYYLGVPTSIAGRDGLQWIRLK